MDMFCKRSFRSSARVASWWGAEATLEACEVDGALSCTEITDGTFGIIDLPAFLWVFLGETMDPFKTYEVREVVRLARVIRSRRVQSYEV